MMGRSVVFKLFSGLFIVGVSLGAVKQNENTVLQKRSVDPQDSPDNAEAAAGGGQTYIRWGRSSCPENADSYLVYKGQAGGSWFDHKGGASNMLCLAEDPIWGTYDEKTTWHSPLHGAEYQTGWPLENDNIEESSHVDQDVPCAVCWVPKRATLMIPGRNECAPGWRLEYHGYLMSGSISHNRGEFLCVDHAPEAHPGGTENKNGALLYYVEANCVHSLRCPPYVNGREVTCVVCAR